MLKRRTIITVSQLTRNIRQLLESSFDTVWVEGEVSNVRQPSSGHIYFTLKDKSAQIRCVMFRGQAQGLRFQLKDGMGVIVSAKVSVYERDGQYQLYTHIIEPKGKGSLQLAFEQLKERLANEGLFDESHKKTIPFLPSKIGIITSPTGAVVQDILHVLEKRFENFNAIIFPVKVQGEGAGKEIKETIEYCNEQKEVDVIILARGGGSIEELWAFNEEIVARAIFESEVPIISAVGHQTDYTIADFVSDVRAPTPSRAAELVIVNKDDLMKEINDYARQLQRNLEGIIPLYYQRIDGATESLERNFADIIQQKNRVFESAVVKLETLNPLSILKRGYSIVVKLPNENIITKTSQIEVGNSLKTKVSKGSFISRVESIEN